VEQSRQLTCCYCDLLVKEELSSTEKDVFTASVPKLETQLCEANWIQESK